MVGNDDLIYTCEKESYNHLVSVLGMQENIRIASEFTNLIDGKLKENFEVENNRFCVIPNYSIIDKAVESNSGNI